MSLRFRPTLLLLSVLIVCACVPTNTAAPLETSPRADPTPTASPVAGQRTASSGQPASTQAPLLARLAVIASRARVITKDRGTTEVQQAQSAAIQVHDRIEVVPLQGQDEQSYSILHFPDLLNLELFSNTSLVLADVRQAAGGSADITLELTAGHIFVHLNDQMSTQVRVWTPYATIDTVTAGAEFDVCRNERLTCVVVKKGVVEINAQDKREIVKAGEAGYVLRDQPPSPAHSSYPTPFAHMDPVPTHRASRGDANKRVISRIQNSA